MDENKTVNANDEHRTGKALKAAGKVALCAVLLRGVYSTAKTIGYTVAKMILERQER